MGLTDNIVFTNVEAILESQTTTQARIDMLDRILTGMENAMLNATTTGQFQEYKIDTGQTRNEVVYRSLNELELSYRKLLRLQDFLYARINNNRIGRVIRLVSNNNYNG